MITRSMDTCLFLLPQLIFADVTHRILWVTDDEGETYRSYPVQFSPDRLIFQSSLAVNSTSPVLAEYVLGYDNSDRSVSYHTIVSAPLTSSHPPSCGYPLTLEPLGQSWELTSSTTAGECWTLLWKRVPLFIMRKPLMVSVEWQVFLGASVHYFH